MQVPMIHLNGTSRQELLNQLEAVSAALAAAYSALKQAAPNGRDYYPLGPEAMERAIAEHRDRLARIDSVKSEVDSLAGAIFDA